MNNAVHELAETELDRACGGGGMEMIQLQTMLSKWELMAQTATSTLRAMTQTTGAVVRNIK